MAWVARDWRNAFMVAVCIVGLGAQAADANAQAAPEAGAREPAEYRKIINRAVREFDAGNYPEARAVFSRAHELYPNARTHLGLGLTAYELRNYSASIEHLEKALASTVKPLNTELRKSAEDVLAKAHDLIGRVQLEIQPSAGRVLVDGVPVALIDGQALVLEVGDHTIEVQTAGYLPERRSLSIVGGEQVKLSVVLSQPEQAPASAQSERAAPPPDVPDRDDRGSGKQRRWYKSPWLWVSVGVVVVAGGVATGLLLRPDPKTVPNDPSGSDTTPPDGVLHALRSW
jgi:hypothetical protein